MLSNYNKIINIINIKIKYRILLNLENLKLMKNLLISYFYFEFERDFGSLYYVYKWIIN